MPEKAPKERIMEAALKVIGEHTLAGTRMQMIADEAGMSSSNLVYHYCTMKDLMRALLEYISAVFDERLAPILNNLPNDFEGKLHGYFNMQKILIEEEKNLDRIPYDFWCRGQIDPEINRYIMDLYENWRKGYSEMLQEYRPSLSEKNLQAISQVILSMMLGASLQFSSAASPYDLDSYLSTCGKMIQLLLQEDT